MDTHTSTDAKMLNAEIEKLKQLLKQAEARHNDWYKAIFDNTKEATLVCETFSGFPSTIVDCNSTFNELIKEERQNIIGRDFMDLMRRGEKKKFFVQALNKNSNQDLNNLRLTFVDGTGEEIKMEVATHFFKLEKGRLSIITLRPENTYKSALNKGIERALANSNQAFFSVKEDNTLIFEYITNSILEISGFSHQQLKLNPMLFWNNCHPADFQKIKRILNDKNSYNNTIEVRFIRKDGQMIRLQFSIFRNADNPHEHRLFALIKDVTIEKKQSRQSKKKEQYDQIILHIAQLFISGFSKERYQELSNYINKQLQADRFSTYALSDPDFNHCNFSPSITIEEQTYTASNPLIWEQLKDEFITHPVLVYHADDEILDIEQSHTTFFEEKSIKSLLMLPIVHNGAMKGYVSCSTLHKAKRWDRADINFLSKLSNLLSIALFSRV